MPPVRAPIAFTADDLDRLADAAVAAWTARPGPRLVRSGRHARVDAARRTADHTVDAVLAVALFLASRKQDGYPDWWGELHAWGVDARPGGPRRGARHRRPRPVGRRGGQRRPTPAP